MRAAMSDERTRTQQSANKRPGSRRFGLIGWTAAALLLCLTTTAWAAEMVANGGFNTISSWTLGGTGASYTTAQNHGTITGAGSILQYSGARNTTTTGTEAQSVSVATGSVIQNKADVSLWAMHAFTGGSSATQTVTISLRYADATTVQIFTGTVTAGSAWSSLANDTLTAFPLTLTQNVNQITVTTVTRGGTVNPSTSSLYVDDIAIVYTPAATDSLTVTSNTAVATTAMPGATDIQMSFLQLNSDATGNGNCVLTSATVDDVNIAAIGTIASLKVHVDNDTNFVNGVLGTATVNTWNGQPTVVDLTGIAIANRTVTNGTPRYLWITYDIDAAAVNGTTAQSRVTAIGVVAPDTAPLGGPWDSNPLLITVGLGCGGCHPNPMLDGASRDPLTGGVVGNHTKHASAQGYDCNLCHLATPATPRHRDTYIAIVDPIQSKVNARYTTTGKSGVVTGAGFVKFTQVTTPVRGNCQNTDCHGGTNAATLYGGPTGSGPQWGSTSADTCSFCHNSNKTNSGGAANAYPTAASPFRSTAAAGAHALHLTATSNLMNGGVLCADCHTTYATVTAAGHVDDATIAAPADVPFPAGSDAYLNTTTPSYVAGSCTVYCHGVKTPGMDPGATDSTPAWTANWTTYVPGTAGTCSNMCHGLPPTDGTHSGKAFPASCKGCHGSTVTTITDPPAIVASFHINGTVEATGCTGCHGTDPKQYPPVAFWGTNKSTADGVGAHVAHIESTATYMTKEAITGETDTSGYWCAECHTTTRGATGHDDAAYPANIVFTNAVESKYNTHTPTITFEGDNNPDAGNGATCSVYCHGAKMPKGDTSGTTKTPTWGVTLTLTGCNVCHGAPPTAGTSAASHTGQAFPGSCKGCHPNTVLDTLNPPTLAAAFHINGSVEATVSCTGCHNGGGTGATKVSSTSSHVVTTIGGTFNKCEDCHPTAKHNGIAEGKVLIPEKPVVGIDYTAVLNGAGTADDEHISGGVTGFWLGGTATTGTTEAEICWNCHDQNNNGSLADAGDVSEWGTNTGGTYNYGTYNKKSWFDATGTWSSANFAYKNGILSTKPGRQARWSSHDTGSTVGTTKEAVGSVICSYCHDVHSINLATGDSGTTKPYLRGTWRPSPYKEDGAPQNGQAWSIASVYSKGTTTTTSVPRSSTAETGYGGYFIDQNTATNPNVTGYVYATNDGLCNLCHAQADLQTAWAGHKNSVKGFANDTAAARNIFSNAVTGRGTTATDRYNPGMAYQGVTNYYDVAKAYMGGLRETASGAGQGLTQPKVNGQAYGYKAANFQWGTQGTAAGNIDITGTSVNADYHSFSCSKCHTPHASRLPRLMITNCLDIQKNTWDDNATFTGDARWNNWANLTPTGTGNKQLAYADTAQNCHRFMDLNNDRDGLDAGESPGWNMATPW